MNGTGIDTSAMLTMLGLVAAVWALVPETARLSFRLSLSWWDWIIIWSVVLGLHAFYFEPVLRDAGWYPVLGPWSWGFDKGGTQYLLFLVLAGYIYVRSRTTKLNRWKLPLFERLATSLLYSRKFEELATLLEHHLETALAFAKASSVRGRLAKWIRPEEKWLGVTIGTDGTLRQREAPPKSRLATAWIWARKRMADLVAPTTGAQQRALATAKTILASRDLVAYLALAKPRLCLRIVENANSIHEDFQDHLFEALLADDSSVLYSELRNSENLAGGQGHRLAIPDENRLLRFYLQDVKTAGRLGVFRSVGEAVLARIDADDDLMHRLNGPLLTYDSVGKHRCPVYTGIQFFRIMILEGLHQRSDDHLWLHYLPHFTRRLVARAREVQPDDVNHEFATPLGYLLYQLADSLTAWINDARELTERADHVEPDSREGNHVYISFEAAEALPGVIEPILRSDRVPRGLKEELLTVTLHTLTDLQRFPQLASLEAFTIEHLVQPYRMKPNAEYLRALHDCYFAQDHVLQARTNKFETALVRAINDL